MRIQVHRISQLAKAFDASKLSIGQLLDAINKESGFDIAYNTLKVAITRPNNDASLDTTINLYAVIALCRYFHLDTAYVLSPPNTAAPPVTLTQGFANSSKFHFLNDDKYCGFFHGYFYSPNQRSTEIIHFTLNISNPGENCSAVLTYYGYPVSPSGERQEDIRHFYGTPVFSTVSSNIYILLTNDFGDFYFMYFDRKYFRKQSLYFRRGIIATPSTIGGFEPVFQSFALFSHEISSEKEPLIRGLLSCISPSFYIKEEDLDELRSQYPVVDEFCNRNGHIINHDSSNVFLVNEAMFLNDPADSEREDDVKALLLMKSRSIFPSRIVYAENELISKFCKNYMLSGRDYWAGDKFEISKK